ncbi:MAG: hemerythrin domain-containing protein [Gammaproteobacteria bacterium]|nr:hemerythrin domain-containing protein [Gammaproteobacteria bacterium]
MRDLVWNEFLEIGVSFIDDDHKKLLKIVADVKSAIGQGDKCKSGRLLSALLKEAKDHFSKEEEYLLEVKFPYLQEHKAYHKELLVKTEMTKRVCEGIETEHDLEECFDAMAEFLVDDILRGDIKFKSYLQYEGYIK